MAGSRRRMLWSTTTLVVGLVLAVPWSGSASVTDPSLDPTFVTLAKLSPRPADAAADLPHVYRSRCHTHGAWAPRLCAFGDRRARKVIVAFGDSHMAQWHGALNRAAHRDGYRLLWASKGACPAPTVRVPNGDACNRWRRGLLRLIVALPRVDLVVMASSSWIPTYWPGTDTLIGTESEREQVWRAGWEKTIKRLNGKGRRIMVIRDTPRVFVDVPGCLLSTGGDTRPCTHARTGALLPGMWTVLRGLRDRFPRVRTVELTSGFCSRSMCRPVTKSLVLRYRDDNHMTNTFSVALAGRIRSRIRVVMGS